MHTMQMERPWYRDARSLLVIADHLLVAALCAAATYAVLVW